jgi:hypothetical protein
LTYIHPETLEIERVELVVCCDGREDFLLDRRRTELFERETERRQNRGYFRLISNTVM